MCAGLLFAQQDSFLAWLFTFPGHCAGQLSRVIASPEILLAVLQDKTNYLLWHPAHALCNSWSARTHAICATQQLRPTRAVLLTQPCLNYKPFWASGIRVKRLSLNINKMLCSARGSQGWAQCSAIGLCQFGKSFQLLHLYAIKFHFPACRQLAREDMICCV